MIHDPIPRDVLPALPLFDAEALDIADYLKAEPAVDDIHHDETQSQGVAALTLGAIGVVYGDIGTSPIYAFREALKATGAATPGPAEVLGILVALFVVQRRGTASVAALFGPICVVWFVVLAGLGLWHIAGQPSVLAAFNPLWGASFLLNHTGVAFVVLGAVFLAVTGGEALYADLGHFGRRPIMLAWFALVLPALVLNYLGQGAMVLAAPEKAEDSFFAMIPGVGLPFLVALATMATVIASQAVITGAFSMARGAIQLGFLPRLRMLHTAEGQSGQIYIGAVNWLLLGGVLWLVVAFGSSGALASAYGIAVTGTMVLTTLLGALYLVRSGRMRAPVAMLVVAPILAVELVFLASNLVKIGDGGYVPVVVAGVVALVMWAWWRGTQAVKARVAKLAISVPNFVRMMRNSSVNVIPGTAFFLTGDPGIGPSALMHNIKHNRVLHEQTVLLTVETLRVPYATADERVTVEPLGGCFVRLILRFGFMETPNVSRAMAHARAAGLKFDVMASTFFLGRRRAVATGQGMELVMDKLYVALSRMAADPTDFYHLPRDRVVELGERVAI